MMISKPIVCLFIGQSGCGKGTQANLLEKRLGELDPDRSVFHLETGDKFRELISGTTHTAKLAKACADTGKLQPAFLAIHIWSHVLIDSFQGDQHVIMDGTPRALAEVAALDSTLNFYDWQPHVIYMNVSDEWARTRLAERHRSDDVSQAEVEERLRWFHTSVVPVVDYLKNANQYVFHEINGEQSIEAVHADIIQALKLS